MKLNYSERMDKIKMTEYFILEASMNVSDYVSVKEGTKGFAKLCQMSEFQFLDSKPCTIEVDMESGSIFQDFIYEQGVPLISDKMKDCFDELGIDYLLYKKVILTKNVLGVEEIYWLALPPRIYCLNREKSEIDEILNVADEIVINDNKVGRYDIFKLAGVGNIEIIVTKKLADKLKEEQLIGLHINQI